MDAATPMLRQYLRIKAENPDSILMFRLGDFYEMFFDDAVLASNILDITLTSRNRNEPNPIPLCGVPYHSVEPYIARLLEHGHKVAICDQVEDPKSAKGVVRREVTRVITPGVVVDGLGLSASSHNFLACILSTDGPAGFAISDISTGFFEAQGFDNVALAVAELIHTEAREVLIPQASKDGPLATLIKHSLPKIRFTEVADTFFDFAAVSHLDGAASVAKNSPEAAKAAGALFSYLSETQRGRVSHIHRLSLYQTKKVMRLDESTKRNLELTRTISDAARKGSLLETMDKTKTAAGARKLKRWLLYPLADAALINKRLDAVWALVSDPGFFRDMSDMLGSIADIERITSRAATGFANARDLIALKNSLESAGEISEALSLAQGGMLSEIGSRISPHKDLSEEINATLVDEPPVSVKDGSLIRMGISKELDELREIALHGKDFIARIEGSERTATGIGSLKVRFNRVFGYYIEVTNTHLAKVPERYIRKQTLANAERFITPELKEYEERVLGAEEKARSLEYEMFSALRSKVAACSKTLFKTAGELSSLDVIVSFASLACGHGYVRPEINEGDMIDIRDGRHPIVERINPLERFVPNDTLLNGSDSRLMLITGPNMAGKSTVMRQTALIVLMAQMGSFVPASCAKIGVVDRIFTRVGASDALAEGKSTFMVEMAEAAVILKEATRKSLIIIDEIGRGTSTFDGLAIAWSVAEDIHDRVKARTMFATHYHELADLALTRPGIKNMQIAVKEWNGEVVFLRRLINGATPHSYGIQVASLAGLPTCVIERAREVLANLESQELDEVGKPKIALHTADSATGKTAQYQLFTQPLPGEIQKRLEEIDIQILTPLEALNILHELKNKII